MSEKKTGKRFELLVLGIRKGIVSKDGKINGKAIVDMTYEEVDELIKDMKGDQSND